MAEYKGVPLPEVGGDRDVWGDKLNDETFPAIVDRFDPALADATVDGTTLSFTRADGGAGPSVTVPPTAERQQMLQESFVASKGSKIGTAGRVPIAIRIDHWLNALTSTILPLLEARSLPAGLCVYSRMLTPGDPYYDPDSSNVSWADVEEMCMTRGVEIWSHGQSHADTPYTGGEEALRAEIVDSKSDLEGFMPRVKVQGWMQPGVTPLGGAQYGWLGFNPTDFTMMSTHMAGRLIRETYPVSELDMIQVRRNLPGKPLHGANHVTIDSMSFADIEVHVKAAINQRCGVEFMVHPGLVGQTGRLTLADFTAFLDLLVSLRDSGEIEVVTPSAMYVTDVESSTRANLIYGGDFSGDFDPVTNPGPWSGTGSSTIVEDDGNRWLRIPDTSTVITQTSIGVNYRDFRGEMFAVECRVRRADPTTSTAARMIVADPQDTSKLNKTWTLTAPSDGTEATFTRHFSIPRSSTRNLRFQFGRNGGGGLDITGCRVYKV